MMGGVTLVSRLKQLGQVFKSEMSMQQQVAMCCKKDCPKSISCNSIKTFQFYHVTWDIPVFFPDTTYTVQF